MAIDVNEVIRQYNYLAFELEPWKTLWQDVGFYIHPRHGNIVNTISPGNKETDELYSSVAIHRNELLAASINSGLTPQSSKWFGLASRSSEVNSIKAVADWFEVCTEAMLLAFRQSNFYSEIEETYLDLGSYCTSALFIEELPRKRMEWAGLNFRAMVPGEYVIAEDQTGQVDTFMRLFRTHNKNILDQFGYDSLSDDLRDKVVSKPYEWSEVLHVVVPRQEWSYWGGNKGYKWASAYIEYGTKHLLSEGGYQEFPYAVARWGKSSGEQYGRGPGITAMPDIKTLNKVEEQSLKAAAKAIDPPMMVLDNGVIGSVRLSPAGLTVVRQPNALSTLPFAGDYKVQQLVVNELMTNIQQLFYTDQLQLAENDRMTAAEVYVRYELMQRILGPTLGRLYNDFLNKIIERDFYIMFRAGQFPPPPQELLDYEAEIDIEYEGPLARAQKAQDITAVTRMLELVGPLAGMKPEILDWIDDDALIPVLAPILGVPGKIIRDKGAVDTLRKAKADMARQQEKKQDLMAIAEGAGKAAPALQLLMGGKGGQPSNA